MNSERSWNVPDHVPEKLVVDFDLFKVEPGIKSPLEVWKNLEASGAPKIFWSPRNGGHWTFLTYEDIREGFKTYQKFSNRHTPIPPVAEENWPVLQPQSADPPDHAKYRNLLTPIFTPKAIQNFEGDVRKRAVALIEKFVDEGRCEFVDEFSSRMPTGMFLQIMGMDESRLEEFMHLSDTFMRVQDPAGKAQNVADINRVLGEHLQARKSQPSRNDITSTLLDARDAEGNPFPDDEVRNCAFLLFLAGLDTVTNTMTLMWRHLAENPDVREQTRSNLHKREVLMRALDELLRLFAAPTIYRRVQDDLLYKDIQFKRNDMVVLPTNVANRDPAVFADPTKVDLERQVNTHLTFGLGVHRCLGQHLARLEIATSLQEWLTRIPDFRVAPGANIEVFAGPVLGLRTLPLEWGG